ncbi:MAG TPA: glycosyltransferase family 2 protein [Gemmataceae bacterium]|nr:glycosyltransferase family 2 protein [Gemmataceae bacterium]
MSRLSISVVIPAYRAARTIRRAVDSVLAQTRPPDEILVIDDGSPDDLAKPLAVYGKRVQLLRKENGGAAAARNLGIERTRGEWIAFLDADDYWEVDKLHCQAAVLQANPHLVLSAARYFEQMPGGSRSVVPTRLAHLFGQTLCLEGEQAFAASTLIWTSTVMVRRTALQGQRFSPGLEPAENGDLWIRLVSSGSFYLHPEPLATAVLEPSSLSRTNIGTSYRQLLHVLGLHRRLLGEGGYQRWKQRIGRQWAADCSRRTCPPSSPGPAWNWLAKMVLTPVDTRWRASRGDCRGSEAPLVKGALSG